ncbi:Protein CBG27961 [Caenorhabditis briggsae]|uniref:Protein CBG27961 n=1 Tax=Caenorhabditis briggsae TaxID=6238 RepID=B6IJQ3_CAEBR|nr:Protein CBG27961 [Caenorhabditis briggsae]CAS00133.1 Protein CBG27961 [Caenorhabditis briggsae]
MFSNYSKDTAPEKKDTVPEKQKVESYLNDKSYPKTDRYPKTYEARKAEVYKDVFGSKKTARFDEAQKKQYNHGA